MNKSILNFFIYLFVVCLFSGCRIFKNDIVKPIEIYLDSNNLRFFEHTEYEFVIENFDSTKMIIESKGLDYKIENKKLTINFNQCGNAYFKIYKTNNKNKEYLFEKYYSVNYYPLGVFTSIGSNGQRVSKDKFKNAYFSMFILNWGLSTYIDVVSFTIVANYEDEIKTISAKGNSITDEQYSLIEKLQNNNIVIIKDFKINGDCSERENPIIYFVIGE